jgi:predicted metal-binding protein
MNAIILVAGKEKKLLPYTNQMHQCLFRLADNQTILENMVEKLVSLKKIEKIIIVVGHKKELVFKELKEIKKRVWFREIICIENKDFLTTNVIYSLWLCRKYLLKPFLLIDGDIICEKELLEKLIHSKSSKENLLLVDFDYNVSPRENKVKVAHNRIVRIGRNVPLSAKGIFGRSIGIGKISAGNNDFIKRMGELVKMGKRKIIYEDVIDELLPKYIFRAVSTYGFNWMEVDSIEEFKRMNNIFSALDKLKEHALSLGATQVLPINPKDIVFDPKVKLFCYNCVNHNKKLTCPPHIPKLDYQKMFLSYKKGLIVALQSAIGEDWKKIKQESTVKLHRILLDLEKFAFTHSYHFAQSFIGGSCKLCNECAAKCRFPNLARIPLEAVGVDVVKTVAKLGIELKFPVANKFYRIGLLLVG